MKKIFYVLIPVIGFGLVLSNALFGSAFFNSSYDQEINRYSVYVHLQPDWESYPGNILFDITNVWSNLDSDKSESFSTELSDLSTITDYNSNQLEFQHKKSFVRLKHDFSNCESSWEPISYRYAVDSLRTKIELVQGTKLNDDPYVSIFPNVPNTAYDFEQQREFVKSGYAQFIPICTSRESTTYEYGISLSDKNIAFDVYFVPTNDEINHYLKSESFSFYDQDGCFAENYNSFSGTCENVGKNSGLLIVLPDKLSSSLTKVEVSIHEKL